MNEVPVLGVIGGTGLYQFPALQDVQTVEIDTPFGKPSSPITIGRLGRKQVAFLARHGIGHFISPTEVNYRANIYALKSLGIQQILSVSACGSLRDDFAPGHVIIPSQVFDFTKQRSRSFFGEGMVAHVGVADPFCGSLSRRMFEAVNQTGVNVHTGGTLITIEGPRFSTKAESNVFRAWGMSIIGMTACPEIFLAREAEMCYCTAAHVTDYDVWHVSEAPVTVEMVIRVLNESTATLQKAIELLVKDLPEDEPCECHSALKDALITNPAKIPPETRQKLDLLVRKYVAG
jgi:5'-methylthioadenosine phosphorylase